MVTKGKILIIGCSLSGLAAAKLLLNDGYDIYVSEFGKLNPKYTESVDELKAAGVHFEFEGHTEDFISGALFAVTSPSVPNQAPVFTLLNKLGINVISELDLAYRYATNKNSFIGITGTNGKTTTTNAVAHILSGTFNAPACGNIGTPPTDVITQNPDWFVTEVSSFQMEKSSEFRTHIACWTNFTPDHITWHGTLEAYFNAKAKMFLAQTKEDFAILNGQDEKLMEFAPKCTGKVFIFDREVEDNCAYISNNTIYTKIDGFSEKIIDLKDCQLSGHHNYQNLMCAILIAKLAGVQTQDITQRVATFQAPEHRMEKFAQLNNITFYNDSKATNPESAIAAIDAFNDTDVVLIAGGRDKLTSLDEFCQSIKKHITSVVLIGEATERFKSELLNNGFNTIYEEDSLQSATDKAISLNPEVVLLSPACASFDMFSGYEERGTVFKEYVLSKISK